MQAPVIAGSTQDVLNTKVTGPLRSPNAMASDVTLLIFLAMAAILLSRARGLHERNGLPDGVVIYTDTGTWYRNQESLHSPKIDWLESPTALYNKTMAR